MDTPPTSRPWLRWLLAGLLLLAVVIFYVAGGHRTFTWEYVQSHVAAWTRQVEAAPVVSALVYFAVYVAATALSLPVALWLSLLGGALFGLPLGLALVSVASTLGATLAFLSSRYVLRDGVRRRLGSRLDALDEGVRRDGAYYLFTLRLLPPVPFFLINLGMGLTPMPVGTFALVSWLGMLPATAVFVNVGTELGRLASPEGLLGWRLVLAFALLGVTPLLLRLLVRRLRRDRVG